MSYYESHVGKLRKVDLEDKTIEEFFEQKCKEDGIERDEYDENWYDCYYANAYPKNTSKVKIMCGKYSTILSQTT